MSAFNSTININTTGVSTCGLMHSASSNTIGAIKRIGYIIHRAGKRLKKSVKRLINFII